ncbi:MAG: OmpA family protein [Spirochaetales bacterium]|nr:OmpA family protein [Spirochaetales bacterium]
MKVKNLGLALLMIATITFAACGGGSTKSVSNPVSMALAPLNGLIKFEYAKTTMSAPQVEKWVSTAAPAVNKALTVVPAGRSLVIVGHANSIGGQRAADNFGLARANFVRNTLRAKGVDVSKIKTKSAGASQENKANLMDPNNFKISFEVQ